MTKRPLRFRDELVAGGGAEISLPEVDPKIYALTWGSLLLSTR